MKRIRRWFYFFTLLGAISGNAFIFGGAGYLVRGNLERELNQIQEQTRELEQENTILYEKYSHLTAETSRGRQTAPEQPEDAIILKFEGLESEAQRADEDHQPGDGNVFGKITLHESRLLYWGLMGFLLLAGGLLIRNRNEAHI